MSLKVKFIWVDKWIVNVMHDVWDMVVSDKWCEIVIKT